MSQRPTTRMQMRIKALNEMVKVIHPGFCECMKCDESCPCFKAGAVSDCAFLQIMNDVARLNSLLKYKDGIVVD